MSKTTRFISPKHIYARIVEEFRSYFSTGSIDQLLFPIWTLDCIGKFENTYVPIQQAVLDIHNYKCSLPCDFKSVRELWLCATVNKGPITAPGVFYYQTDCRIDSPSQRSCEGCSPQQQCSNCAQQPVELPSVCGVPDEYRVVHKVQTHMSFQFSVSCMLKPGNFRTISKCGDQCPNIDAYSTDTFDIAGDKLLTSFYEGTLYMAYYANYAQVPDDDGTDAGYYMIPDNQPFQEYLYHYLRYMIYDQLFNQSTDETFNQMKYKLERQEQLKDEAYIGAKTYAISSDVYSLQRNIIRSRNKNNMYILKGPTTTGRRY